MRHAATLVIFGLNVLWIQSPEEAQLGPKKPGTVFRADLAGEAITPVTARFLKRAIREAEEERGECLVIVLDTPGGLVDSTRDLVKAILGSSVPVAVYVAPSGAHAASAGFFITLSASISAMAPGSNIGAAHPVQLGPMPGTPPQEPSTKDGTPPPMGEKILNDTVAWARSLAELRGRNVEWAIRAVTDSISATADEAFKEGVVDFVAEDFQDLLGKLDGRRAPVRGGFVTLQTKGVVVRFVEMWWGERLLAILANPNLAFFLMILGFYGVLFELYSPGWGVPGTLGIVCLILAFLGLAVLPINYTGLALLLISLGLFAAEIFVTSYGILSLAGVLCLILGGIMLVDSPTGFLQVSIGVIAPVATATALIVGFLIFKVLRAQHHPVLTGGEGLLGTRAVAKDAFSPTGETFTGLVEGHGELWKAVSKAPVTAGDLLVVQGREGLTLFVEKVRAEDIES